MRTYTQILSNRLEVTSSLQSLTKYLSLRRYHESQMGSHCFVNVKQSILSLYGTLFIFEFNLTKVFSNLSFNIVFVNHDKIFVICNIQTNMKIIFPGARIAPRGEFQLHINALVHSVFYIYRFPKFLDKDSNYFHLSFQVYP